MEDEDKPIEATDETPRPVVPPEEIQTVRHMHGMGHVDFVRLWLTKTGRLDDMPVQLHNDAAVEARIDDGRWVVDCPFCPGAEMADLDDPRFFCLSCSNRAVKGMWLAVVIPTAEERASIEKAILERPRQFRHWRPGQTVADVQTENIVHEAW